MTSFGDDTAQICPEEAILWLVHELDVDTNEAIRWLVRTAGQTRWLKRADELLTLGSQSERELRSVLERHHVEVCIAAAFRRLQFGDIEDLGRQPFLDAFAFALITKAIHSHLSARGKERHAGKLKQALKEDYGFAALRTEHTAMMMGFGIGCKVVPTDLEGVAAYDMLFSDQGEEVEVECKLLTHDFGSTQFRLSEFQRLCRALDAHATESLLRPGSSRIAWLTLQDKLPRQDTELRSLAGVIAAAVAGEQEALPAYVKELRMEDWPRGISEPKLAHAEARFITVFQHCATFALDGERSAFIIAINHAPDPRRYAELVERKFKDAADQLSGTRPGVIFAELEGPNVDAGLMVKILPQFFKDMLQAVFKTRPFLELVILGFPGPPFSSGVSVPIRNPRRKKRSWSYISRKLERNSQPIRSSTIPFKEFRKEWWQEKYRWDHKTPDDVLEALRRHRSTAKKL